MGSGIAGGLESIPKYFVTSPPKKHLLFAMVVAALLFPIAGNDIFSKTGFAIFLIVPAILSSALTWRIVRKLGGFGKEKHSLFMSTVSLFFVAIVLAGVSAIEDFYIFKEWNSLEILFVALAAVFALQLLVFFAVGGLSLYRAAVPASLYVIFSAALLFTFKVVTFRTLAHFLGLVFVTFVLVWLFVKLTDAPFKRTLGVSTSKLVALALREYTDPESIDINPFETAGKNAEINFQALKYDFGKGKYLLAIPWLHPGPIESIGGKIPNLITSMLKSEFERGVFMHTYVDHSLNPIFPDKIVRKIKEIVLNPKYFAKQSAKASKFIEVRKNGVNVIAQKIGEVYFFITSFAPEITDDISFAVGLNLLGKFGNKAIFVDAHNSMRDDEYEDPVGIGDEKAKNLADALEFAGGKLDRLAQGQLKIGIASSQKSFIHEGVKGISAVVFEIEGQKTAIIVLDMNNAAGNFRDRIRKKLNAMGFAISEVITTDAHLGDSIMKKYGKTGLINPEILEKEIIQLAEKAAEELKTAKVSCLSTTFQAKIFGEKLYHQIVATASSVIPFAKFVAISMIIAFLFSAHVLLQL